MKPRDIVKKIDSSEQLNEEAKEGLNNLVSLAKSQMNSMNDNILLNLQKEMTSNLPQFIPIRGPIRKTRNNNAKDFPDH